MGGAKLIDNRRANLFDRRRLPVFETNDVKRVGLTDGSLTCFSFRANTAFLISSGKDEDTETVP